MKRTQVFATGLILACLSLSCASRSVSSFGPYSAAETYDSKGNYSKAIEHYQEYLTANPQGSLAPIAEYYIAKSYAASGDQDQARGGFERVVSQFPDSSWADFATEQLDLLKAPGKV